MFLLINLATISLAIVALAIPPGIAMTRLRLVPGLALSLMLTAIVTFICYYWADRSIDLKLWWLGTDPAGFTFEEQLRTVAPKHRQIAQDLINARLGIGWALSAIFAVVFLATPYVFAAFATVRLVRRKRAKARMSGDPAA
ncbi:hypothetical protein [Salipiger abyssi]|uniref:hypothetical protein n=1 Tax=Salipiger abyssi TaxID=1250539 RepID=UPI001A8CF01D|nr:hypothetical protein [Salipiger abyssi]MBN9886621.1 hypothetical protein [Salipiger abyssi]